MNTRLYATVAVFAIAAPLVLLLVAPRMQPKTIVINWLYMAVPQILVIATALFSSRMRSAATLALALLTLLLLLCQAWAWWWDPDTRGLLAWALYFPLALGIVLVSLYAQRSA